MILVLTACKEKEFVYEPSAEFFAQTEREARYIGNVSQIRLYLGDIARQDKFYRRKETKIIVTDGVDSEAYAENKYLIFKTDIENVIRIETILRTFGLPDSDSIGWKATNIPVEIISRSTDFKKKKDHYNMFYEGYKSEQVRPEIFEAFIDGMYVNKFQEDFKMSTPYRMEEKIDTLMTLLELN